jgi:hypothetical protein
MCGKNPAQHGGGRVQGVGRRPGGVRGLARIGRGERLDLSTGVVRHAGGIIPDRASFGHRESVSCGITRPGPRRRSFGRVRSAASFPPPAPYQTGFPPWLVSQGRATAYPVTSPGLRVLLRVRTSTPDHLSPAKNSCSSAAAAAVLTWRRSVSRGAAGRPRRPAFSDSALLGPRAAVRSPVRCITT